MEWIKYLVRPTTGVDWWSIDPAVRGHHAALLSACGQRENKGVIGGGWGWSDRVWYAFAGASQKAVASVVAAGLAEWDGEDLRVLLYVDGMEEKAKSRRDSASTAASARWERHRAARDAAGSASGNASRIAAGSASGNADQRRGEERRTDPPVGPPGDLTLFGAADPAPRKAKRTTVDRHRAEAEQLWRKQEELRRDVNPRCEVREPDDERLARVADRLDHATPAQAEKVLGVYHAEAKCRGTVEWFDGVTNWRRDNFDRALGRAGGASPTSVEPGEPLPSNLPIFRMPRRIPTPEGV